MSVQDVDRSVADVHDALGAEREFVNRLSATSVDALRATTDTALDTLIAIAREAVTENEAFRLTVARWYQAQGFPRADVAGLLNLMELVGPAELARKLTPADGPLLPPPRLRPSWWVRTWERLTGLDAGGRWT